MRRILKWGYFRSNLQPECTYRIRSLLKIVTWSWFLWSFDWCSGQLFLWCLFIVCLPPLKSMTKSPQDSFFIFKDFSSKFCRLSVRCFLKCFRGELSLPRLLSRYKKNLNVSKTKNRLFLQQFRTLEKELRRICGLKNEKVKLIKKDLSRCILRTLGTAGLKWLWEIKFKCWNLGEFWEIWKLIDCLINPKKGEFLLLGWSKAFYFPQKLSTLAISTNLN